MIRITDIRSLKKEPADLYVAAVRSMKRPIEGVLQLADLSPSRELFYRYLDLKKAGSWNRETFETVYRPRFLRDLAENPNVPALLNRLWQIDRQGKTAAIACFCADESLCHRSLLGGILAGAGCGVRTQGVPDRSLYEQWCALCAQCR